MKPLLTRIEEELSVCTDPFRRAELLGEKGCYLARIGQFSTAREIVGAIRSDDQLATQGRVAVRIMFLEGLLLYFEHLDAGFRDRMVRAHAISHAAGYIDLARLTAAWIALADLDVDDFRNAYRMLSYALQAPDGIDDMATIRAHLVLADINMLAGRVDSAKGLYELARRGSVALGDDSTLAATFYNRANMLLNHERVSLVLGKQTNESRRNLELEIRSVNLYHRGTGQTSLAHLLGSINAMLLFLNNRFQEAAELYRELLMSGKMLNVGADDSIQSLEYALCLASSGRAGEARDVVSALELAPKGRRLFDDRLIIASLKHKMLSEFGISVNIDRDTGDLVAAIARYESDIEALALILDTSVE